jgi:hypothetical protein
MGTATGHHAYVAVHRWWVGSGAILTVAIIVGVAWSQDAPVDRNADDVAQSATPTTSEWCMPVSRAAVIARIAHGDGMPRNAKVSAKLFGTDYWAVEVEGSPSDLPRLRDTPVGWVVYNVDAHTGDLKGASAGPPGSTATDWNALPDRTSSC